MTVMAPVSLDVLSSERLKIRFPSADAFWAAQAAETAGLATAVLNAERRVISVVVPTHELTRIGFDQSLRLMEETYGAEVVPDVRFDMETTDLFDPENFGPDAPSMPSLDEVLEMIFAREAWAGRLALQDAIRDTTDVLGGDPHCGGAGTIHCQRALAAI